MGQAARRVSLVLATVLWLLSAGGWSLRGAQPEDLARYSEHEQKLLLMCRLAVYTEWPAESMGDAEQPIILGILGQDPFGSATNLVAGRTVKKRRIEVKHFRSPEELRACHLLYFGGGELNLSSELADKFAAYHILTFGDSEDFERQGGVVSFVKDGTLVRFNVNKKALKAAKLNIAAVLVK